MISVAVFVAIVKLGLFLLVFVVRYNRRSVCCGSILSLVQIFFSFVFGYGNV